MSALTIRVFDTAAAGYDARYQRPIDRAEADVIYGALHPWITDRNVLDVGCGTGALLDHTTPRSYLGLDASPNMLREARAKHGRNGSRHTFVCADVSGGSTAIKPGVLFDTVLCLWAFPYFEDPVNAIKWMTRHLAPGGWLIVQGWSRRYLRHEHCAPPEAIHTTTPAGLRAYLELARLTDIDVQGFRWLGDHGWMRRVPATLLAELFGWEARFAPPNRCLTHFAYGRRPGHRRDMARGGMLTPFGQAQGDRR